MLSHIPLSTASEHYWMILLLSFDKTYDFKTDMEVKQNQKILTRQEKPWGKQHWLLLSIHKEFADQTHLWCILPAWPAKGQKRQQNTFYFVAVLLHVLVRRTRQSSFQVFNI